MNEKRPLILITNDDGVEAKGLGELIRCLRDTADLFVMAPDGPRSGMSSSITSLIPLRCSLVKEESGLTIYKCTGTPVDCIKLSLNEIMKDKPDLVVAGINHGGNMAICVQYSGTMGAVAEGCVFNIPSIGLSLMDHNEDADFSETCRLGINLIKKVLREGLPKGVYLNLNVPLTDKVKGVRICRQADGRWTDEYVCSTDGYGKPVYWMTGRFESNPPILPDNDMNALYHGYASLVPCKIDVTDYDFMKEMDNGEWSLDDE